MEPNWYRYTEDKKKRYYDFTLLFMVVSLMIIGIIMISSISSYNAAKYLQDANFYTQRQIRYAVVGTVGMLVISMIDYRVYAVETPRRRLPILLIMAYLGIVALELAVIVVGHSDSDLSGAANGANRWLAIGPFKLQPGEFAKLFLIVIAAYAMCKISARKNRTVALLLVCAAFAIMIALAAKESMTTGIVMAAVLVGLIFVCSKKKLWFAVALAVVAVAVLLVVRYGERVGDTEGGFRFRRIYEWRHLEDEDNLGQVKQGVYAISSGGLFGKGFGNSAQKLGHIPEVHTDMIFACVVEEIGLVGGAAIIVLFALLLWRIAIVAINAPDLYGMLVCYGVLIHIGLQVCINIAVVTGTFPSTGVTLPFISYGGSSLIVLCAECGLVLNVSRNIGYRKSIVLKEPEETTPAKREKKPGTSFGRAAGGLRKVKDDHRRKKPARRGEHSRTEERPRREKQGGPSAPGNSENVRKGNGPETQKGGYRMDITLGQPSRRDDT